MRQLSRRVMTSPPATVKVIEITLGDDLHRSFDFDPKELHGIGIQIQKLEKADAGEVGRAGNIVVPACITFKDTGT